MTPSPTVVPKTSKMDDSAVATSAPKVMGVHVAYREEASSEGTLGSIAIVISAQPKEGQDRQDNHDQADQINQTVHVSLL